MVCKCPKYPQERFFRNSYLLRELCADKGHHCISQACKEIVMLGDEVLTVREVSTYLRLAQSTVYKLAHEGKLPGRKIGGTWRFSKQRLDEWLQRRSDIPEADFAQAGE